MPSATQSQGRPLTGSTGVPYLGAGFGLRQTHHELLINDRPPLQWLEVLTENHLHRGGRLRADLMQIAEIYPLTVHGVGMSVGTTDPIDYEHLKAVKQLNRDLNSAWTSEHLCFTVVDHTNLTDLIPLPWTEESANHVGNRIRIIQDYLELPFLIENITAYMILDKNALSELEFISRVLDKAGCGLLLDVNNVYINSRNHGFDPVEFICSLPADKIGQIHLGGHTERTDMVIDTHDAKVTDAVWELFRETIAHCGPVNTNIEWDNDFLPWEEHMQEIQVIENILEKKGFKN